MFCLLFIVCIYFHLFLGVAHQLFDNLKKRYSKRRQAVLKESKSGSGRGDVDSVTSQLKNYGFMAWINPFCKTRNSKSNFVLENADDNVENYKEQKDNEEEDETKEAEGEEDKEKEDGYEDSLFEESSTVSSTQKRKNILTAIGNQPPNWKRKRVNTDQKEKLMSTMSVLMQQRIDKNSSTNSVEEEKFGGMIAAELAKLPEYLRIQAKYEINRTIFKFQLQNQQIMQLQNFGMPSSFLQHQAPVTLPTNLLLSASASAS